MRKIFNVILIGVLFLVVFTTIGLVWGQNTTKTIKGTVNNNKIRTMKDLTVENDLQKYGVEVITFSDNSFDDLLTQYVGNNEDVVSQVELSKPFAFFIENNSSKEVVGVSLQWKFIKSNGVIERIPQIEANPGILMGIKPLDPKMRGKTSLINSKSVKFFTYFKDTIGNEIDFANMRLNNPSVNYKYQVDTENRSREISHLNHQKEKIFDDYTDISVSIDGIFFNDGTFVGEDQNFFFDTLRGDVEARKNFLTALGEAKSSGKNNSDIVNDILSNISNISVSREELLSSKANPEQAFINSYKTYLKNLRRELVMQRLRVSDDYIISQMQSVKVSDFKKLRKIVD